MSYSQNGEDDIVASCFPEDHKIQKGARVKSILQQTPVAGAKCGKCDKPLQIIAINNLLLAYWCDNENCENLGLLTRAMRDPNV